VPKATPSSTSLTTLDRTVDPRRWIACGAILAVLGIASFGACGSSEGAPPVPIEDLPRLIADAVCNNIGPCCAQAGFPHDAAACHAFMEGGLQREFEIERLQPNRTYDAVAGRACVDANTAIVSTAISRACTAGPWSMSDPCRRLFVGTLPVGQACFGGDECVPGSTCHPTGDGTKRQCTDWNALRGKLGQSCLVTCAEVEEAKDGVNCSGGGGAGGGPGGSVGVNCFTNDGLYCDRANGCAKMPSIGEACSTAFCAGEAFCDQGICAAKGTSGPCGLIDSCAAIAYCGSDGQCQMRKTRGEACLTDGECPTGDFCEGTCRLRTIVSAQLCSGKF
jgi:hypothetical protein